MHLSKWMRKRRIKIKNQLWISISFKKCSINLILMWLKRFSKSLQRLFKDANEFHFLSKWSLTSMRFQLITSNRLKRSSWLRLLNSSSKNFLPVITKLNLFTLKSYLSCNLCIKTSKSTMKLYYLTCKKKSLIWTVLNQWRLIWLTNCRHRFNFLMNILLKASVIWLLRCCLSYRKKETLT